jgi:hypothetical protein
VTGRVGPDVSTDPTDLTYKVKQSKSILDPDREATTTIRNVSNLVSDTTLTFQTTFPAAPLTVPTISQFSILFVGKKRGGEERKKKKQTVHVLNLMICMSKKGNYVISFCLNVDNRRS